MNITITAEQRIQLESVIKVGQEALQYLRLLKWVKDSELDLLSEHKLSMSFYRIASNVAIAEANPEHPPEAIDIVQIEPELLGKIPSKFIAGRCAVPANPEAQGPAERIFYNFWSEKHPGTEREMITSTIEKARNIKLSEWSQFCPIALEQILQEPLLVEMLFLRQPEELNIESIKSDLLFLTELALASNMRTDQELPPITEENKTGIDDGIIWVKGQIFGHVKTAQQEVRLRSIFSLEEGEKTPEVNIFGDEIKDDAIRIAITRINDDFFDGKKVVNRDLHKVYWRLTNK